MAQMQVFVSHSHEDDVFCRAVVTSLREAGADVWYDEHNLGSGQLMEVIQRELGRRPVVILILSKAAFASRWVRREMVWAYELLDRDPSRLLLPVTAGPIARADFDPNTGWLFLHDFKRIEASGYLPFPTEEAMRRLLHALALTPAGETLAPTAPQPGESAADLAADLIVHGRALIVQQRSAEATPLFECAAQLNPLSFAAWAYLGIVLTEAQRYAEALAAYEHALTLNANLAWVWANKGTVLNNLKRYEEALAAINLALALAPNFAAIWADKGLTLRNLQRYEEALAAIDRAMALDRDHASEWLAKGAVLSDLKRYEEALAAYDHAAALAPNLAPAWTHKGNGLSDLKRHEEALEAYDRAVALGETALRWNNRAKALRALGRTAEAEAAERRAKEMGG